MIESQKCGSDFAVHHRAWQPISTKIWLQALCPVIGYKVLFSHYLLTFRSAVTPNFLKKTEFKVVKSTLSESSKHFQLKIV